MCHHSDCGCERHTYIERAYHHHEGCGCGHHGHPLRHFPTREETIQGMEDYLKQLRAEAKGVEERLSEMQKEG